MMTAIASYFVLSLAHGSPLACPVTGDNVDHKMASTDYNGVRYSYCCPACKATFEKSPAKFVKSSLAAGKTSGVLLFDPISGNRLEHDKAASVYSDFGGVRFLFEKEANKAIFDKDPKRYGSMPAKEALYCPVSKEVVASYADASGFVDHKGIRYYMCCPGCESKFAKDADRYASESTKFVKTPGVANAKTSEVGH